MSRDCTLRQMRIGAGLTQEQVARALGVRQSTISMLESGKRGTSPDRLAMLVSILSRNRATDPAAALESDRTRPTAELMAELVALKDLIRSVGLDLIAGGDPDSLNRIGQGALLRVQQIMTALLSRAPVAGGTQ